MPLRNVIINLDVEFSVTHLTVGVDEREWTSTGADGQHLSGVGQHLLAHGHQIVQFAAIHQRQQIWGATDFQQCWRTTETFSSITIRMLISDSKENVY